MQNQPVEYIRRFGSNKVAKLIILEALEKKGSTISGIQEYAEDQCKRDWDLNEWNLIPHLIRLEEIYFIGKRENKEAHYRLLERGKNALNEYEKYGIESGGRGLRNLIRWQIVEHGRRSTTDIIDDFKFWFGLAKRGRRKSDKKHKIIDEINSMAKSPEFEFKEGGLGFMGLNVE